MQYGVPLRVLVNKFSHTRFEPMGHTSNPDIRIAKSLVDYIFRWLDLTFQSTNGSGKYPMPGSKTDSTPPSSESNGKVKAESNGHAAGADGNGNGYANGATNGHAADANRSSNGAPSSNGSVLTERAASALAKVEATLQLRSARTSTDGGQGDQFARFQSDAPACDNCGSITVRHGNCYLCHNCGNSMGCS